MTQRTSILHEMRDWILHEYSLPIMEAHHDGHPIEHCARRIYDKICKAIEETETESGASKFRCSECGKPFGIEQGCNDHIREKHEGDGLCVMKQ